MESFAVLEPDADGFRNYLGKVNRMPAEYLLIDRANLLTLSAAFGLPVELHRLGRRLAATVSATSS